jgi:hypothetical protein
LRQRLLDQFLAGREDVTAVRAAADRARRRRDEVQRAAGKVDVMVLKERPRPRPTHVLVRGVWDQKGEPVAPGVPAALSPWPSGAPKNRLGLARWLVDRNNPLTARVTVNRCWQMLFGAGLVRTPEDFGLQGERPTHPDLLDWLAVEFMDGGWDVKRLLRLIVTSATYRQASDARPEVLARDPENRLLARGARFRLPSWMIRDAALRASGLLNPTLGGPPVRPYQPEGVWEDASMGRFHYEPSEGPDRYRRTIYGFWRRSVAPTFLFDSAQRRVCEVRQTRTNTPLHALTLLNDPTYVEAAIALAGQALAGHELPPGSTPAQRIREIYRRVLARAPGAQELKVLERQLAQARDYYGRHPGEARKLVAHAQPGRVPAADAAELAAYTLVAGTVLNLDEAVTRE